MRLEVERLAFGYPGRPVGADVSFALEPGEVLCWLGPNGGGKTTLLRTILRLLEPRGGAVRVGGESVARWSRTRLARVFGYVPQAQAGIFPFTVRQVVLMGRTAHLGLFASPSEHDRAVADETLAALGIDTLADRAYTELSGGERQLALVARALAQEPRILVMDEPTASLDFGNQVRVLALVQALAARGIAVMLSTHDPDQAFLCAHQVAVLHEGRLAGLGPPTAVITAETLRTLYGIEVDVVTHARPDGSAVRVCLPSLAIRAGGSPAGVEPGAR
jgi:ABC-type cobalamin/Fe3+-siderophores transport system ATPase subunit